MTCQVGFVGEMVDPYSTAGLAHESDGRTGILKGLWLNRGVEGEWMWSAVLLSIGGSLRCTTRRHRHCTIVRAYCL
jgi:hypothetical protein